MKLSTADTLYPEGIQYRLDQLKVVAEFFPDEKINTVGALDHFYNRALRLKSKKHPTFSREADKRIGSKKYWILDVNDIGKKLPKSYMTPSEIITEAHVGLVFWQSTKDTNIFRHCDAAYDTNYRTFETSYKKSGFITLKEMLADD